MDLHLYRVTDGAVWDFVAAESGVAAIALAKEGTFTDHDPKDGRLLACTMNLKEAAEIEVDCDGTKHPLAMLFATTEEPCVLASTIF